MRDVLGLDIGGANLKAAHVTGPVRTLPFHLWKQPERLTEAVRGLVDTLPWAARWAVTMTGELCDCYASKRAGVHAILDAIQAAAGTAAVQVWMTDGQFVSPAEARARYLEAAASNWLALATFAGRFALAGTAVLLDIGSTTTDVIPLSNGRPVPLGRTDPERLRTGELVYTGVRRTPLCALLTEQVAAEFFATTEDAYLVLGLLSENAENSDTADGRPATVPLAHARLARMLCADLETCTEAERLQLSRQVLSRQLELIRAALRAVCARLPAAPGWMITAGSGEFLARLLADEEGGPRLRSWERLYGTELSTAACAHAVAVLAAEGAHGP